MSSEVRTDRKLQNKAVLGVLLMIAGLALYPLADGFIKHLMQTYSVPQTTFLRSLTRLIPLLVAVSFQGGYRQVFKTDHPKQHLIRLAVNLFYTLAFMYAISMGSLTNVYIFSYTSPLFMIILSAIMLKEQINREKWIAVAVGLVGVIIALRPGSNVLEMAAIFVLVGTFLGAVNKILMRRLASTEHTLAIAIYPNIMMVLVMLPFLIGSWKAMPLAHWGLFAIVGVITATGQYAIAQSLRFAQGSTLAPIDYSTIFWVVAIDFVWWDKTPDTFKLIGAAVIVGSNLFILYRTRKEEAIKKAALATNEQT